jgi:hypothetical protein
MVKTFFRKRAIVFVGRRYDAKRDCASFYGAEGIGALLPNPDATLVIAIPARLARSLDRRKLKKQLPELVRYI